MRILSAFVACVLMLCAAAANAQEPVKWRYYSVIPASHDFGKRVVEGLKAIEDKTQGQLSIRFVFYGETPYKSTDALSVLKRGQVEMTEWLPSYSAGTYPLLAAPELPFLLPTISDPAAAQAGIDRAWAAPAMKAELDRVMAENGGQMLTHYYYEPMNFWFTKPVKNVADFSGKRVRVFSPELSELIEAFKASPVSLGNPEVYSALQRNSLDGVITGVGNLGGGGQWKEVLRSGFIANPMFVSSSMLVNKEALAKLPPKLREVLLAELATLNKTLRAYMPESDRTKKAELRGMANFTLTDASAADYATMRKLTADNVWVAWKKRVGDKGAQALDEILKQVETAK
ncbi:MAG: TRAP transporter substrate-binding protein [Reyranellaceae bacterium]